MLAPDEITEKLKQASAAVENAALKDDLRVVAFERALDALGLSGTRSGSPDARQSSESGGETDTVSPAGSLVAATSKKLRIPESLASQIYEERDGQVRLAIGPGMLPSPDRKAAAMRDVALLTAVGRQAAQVEEYTPFKVIREECEVLGVLDANNFATEVGRLGFRTQGPAHAREVRANRGHEEAAAALIRKMLEETA